MASENSNPTWDDTRITAYALGELVGSERDAFESELAGNPDLRMAVDEARTLTQQLSELFEEETPSRLEPARRQQISAEVARAADGFTAAPRRDESERAWVGSSLAIAACLMVAVGYFLFPGWETRRPRKTAVVSESSRDDLARVAPRSSPTPRVAILESAGEDPAEDAWGNSKPPSAAPIVATPVPQEVEAPSSRRRPDSRQESGLNQSVAAEPATTKSALAEPGDTARPDSANLTPDRSPITATLEPSIAFDAPAEIVVDRVASDVAEGSPALEMSPAANGEGMHMQADVDMAADMDMEADVDIEADMGMGMAMKAMRAAPPSRQPAFYGEPARRGSARRGALGAGRAKPLVAPLRIDSVEVLQAESQVPSRVRRGEKPVQDEPAPSQSTARFIRVMDQPHSTFSIDVDTASYSKTRDSILQLGRIPDPSSIRLEEWINYFQYTDSSPAADAEHPFACYTEMADCPWNAGHRLVRIAIKGRGLGDHQRPRCNLVFLVDTSGSMDQENKLPLVATGIRMLVKQLRKDDRVAIATYAGDAGMALDSTPVKNLRRIRRAVSQMSAGGGTHGSAGIQLAYQTAQRNFIPDGINRVILCTDGDFNVGTTNTDALVDLVQAKATDGVFLTVLGFGSRDLNDEMLEKISGRGDGNYAFIDSKAEARRVLVQQLHSTLFPIARDVKVQVVFNQRQVEKYRLLGYENRILAAADFNDDARDAGEVGVGHTVSAVYEITPTGDELRPTELPREPLAVEPSPYLSSRTDTSRAMSTEVMTVRLRYKPIDADRSVKMEVPVADTGGPFAQASSDFRFTAAVAGFAMQLRRSDFAGAWALSDVRSTAAEALGTDPQGRRSEFLRLVDRARDILGRSEK